MPSKAASIALISAGTYGTTALLGAAFTAPTTRTSQEKQQARRLRKQQLQQQVLASEVPEASSVASHTGILALGAAAAVAGVARSNKRRSQVCRPATATMEKTSRRCRPL